MAVDVWNTGQDVEPGFARAWEARLARTPHANFSMSLDYLAWQGRHGERARAVLAEDGSRKGAMVLRAQNHELVCGFPWRWQMVVEDRDPAAPEGMTQDDASWLFRCATRVAGPYRLRFYSPHRESGAAIGFNVGRTILLALAHRSEEELFDRMEHGRRRRTRKCAREGYEVGEDVSLERQQAFARVVDDTHVRRHQYRPKPLAEAPAPGEEWRTWELPWHWLLLALKDGSVVAGLGLGRRDGAMADARASGSTEEALRTGVNVLVQWEAIRRARAVGHTWMNFGGDTQFKREFGGTVVPIYCRLGGGARWLAPNLIESWVMGNGLRGARVVRNLLRAPTREVTRRV